MKLSFRKIVLASVAVAAIAATTASAKAESLLKVPFSFKVAGKVCPAGVYEVAPGFNHNLLILKNRDSKVNFTWVLTPGDPAPTSTKVTMKFDTIGDSEFLHSIQYGSMSTPTLDKADRQRERPISHVIQGQ